MANDCLCKAQSQVSVLILTVSSAHEVGLHYVPELSAFGVHHSYAQEHIPSHKQEGEHHLQRI